MKKIILAAAILVSGLAINKQANAQVSLNVGVNIGSQPDWGPTGYDRADYYYLPDIDTYYSVASREFVYLNGNRWTRSRSLPARYGNFSLYDHYKVVINERNPWEHDATYRNRYARFKGRKSQDMIRYSRDAKYRNHGQSSNTRTVKTKTVVRKTNNGNHNGWNNGRGNGH